MVFWKLVGSKTVYTILNLHHYPYICVRVCACECLSLATECLPTATVSNKSSAPTTAATTRIVFLMLHRWCCLFELFCFSGRSHANSLGS